MPTWFAQFARDALIYWFHFRGFLIGTGFSVVLGLVAALIVTLTG